MRIFVVAALHGDELFGLKIIGRIKHIGKNNILTKVGHPEAIAKRKKYIDADLNRSFQTQKNTTESIIAKNIKHELEQFEADLLIDIHTSITSMGNVAIAAKHSNLIEYVAKILGMEALVIMPKRLTKKSLIGCYPEKSISIEFGRHNRSDKLASKIANRIELLNISNQQNNNSLPVFEVFAEIEKKHKKIDKIKNLEYNKELGGYPFLASSKGYEKIGGFLARKLN